MASSQSFFKPQQTKTTNHTTPSIFYMDGRADVAVAVFLIDYLLTTTHQKNPHLPEILLKPLLKKLQEDTSLEKPSLGYLTPIKYLQHLCLTTNPNHLVPALADVLNQLTLDYLRNHARAYTSAFLNTTPHTLSSENLKQNPSCLNPWIPSVISRLLKLPFYISETEANKTLPKTSPDSNNTSVPGTGIQLHWYGGQCFVSARIQLKSHFENLDHDLFPTRTAFIPEDITQHIQHVSQEAERSTNAYNTTKNQLNKYFITEKTSTSMILNIYLNYLNQSKHTEHPSAYFDTTFGTQDFFQHAPPPKAALAPSKKARDNGLREGLINALARLLTLGEQLDMTATLTEKSEHTHATSTP